MDGKICYLNTDLDLTPSEDLTELAGAFEAAGVPPLYVTHGEDGLWYATFETDEQHNEPESSIAAMIAVAEALQEPLQSVWSRCSRREFNIGFDCGGEPWGFNHGLSSGLLGRVAAVGASLRVALSPDREPRMRAGGASSPSET